jgi:8-oxo-dGTP pyrophosphatase MutT (NUDIX family)
MSKPIFPAATAIIIRDGSQGLEVLMLRRSKAVAFAGGSWVFPGGRIDDADFAGSDNLALASRRAAVRETLEEAALEIAEEALHYYFHWTAPENTPKRFATWFYLAQVPADAPIEVDGSEIDHHQWLAPKQALQAMARQEMSMLPPTYVTLIELARCATAAEALAFSQSRPAPEFLPQLTLLDDVVCMLYPGDAGYESRDNQCPGKRHRLLMDGGRWRYLNTLDQ